MRRPSTSSSIWTDGRVSPAGSQDGEAPQDKVAERQLLRGRAASPFSRAGERRSRGEAGGGGRGQPRCRGPRSTTSKALAGTGLSWFRSSSSQEGLVSPLIYQSEPLSATNIPYFSSAVGITREAPRKRERS